MGLITRILLAWVLWSVPAWAVSPTLVQLRTSPVDENLDTTGPYELWLPNPTLSGNCLVLGFQSGGGTFTITDDGSNTWTQQVTITNGQIFTIWTAPNVAAGTRNIHVTVASGIPSFLEYFIAEFYNCHATTPVDVTFTLNGGTAPNLSFGANTTTINDDLVLTWGANVTASDNLNYQTFTAGTSGTLLAVDSNAGSFVQTQPKATAGSFTPNITVRGTDTWTGAGIALKGGVTGGTAPTAGQIRIVKLMGQNVGLNANGPFNMQFPTMGNMGAISAIGQPATGGSAVISSVSHGGGTWARAGNDATNTGIGVGQIFYACGLTPSATASGSITLDRTTGGGFHNVYYYYDIENASASCFDVAANASGTQAVTGNVTTGTITPTSQPGLTIATGPINAHCINGLTTPSTFRYDGAYTPALDGGNTKWAECDMWGHTARHTSATGLQYIWTTQNNPSGIAEWAWVGAAFREVEPVIVGCRLLQDGTSKRLLQDGSSGRLAQGGGSGCGGSAPTVIPTRLLMGIGS